MVCAGCAVILGAAVKSHGREMALPLSLAAVAVVLLAALRSLAPLLAQLEDLAEGTGLSLEPLGAVAKAVGIALMGQLTARFCRDAGESALASAVELAERAAILAVALPLLTRLLSLVEEIIAL